MKIKFVAAASLLAIASVGAQAANTPLGAVVIGVPLPFFGLANGPLNDTFTFSLPANGGSGYSVTNFTLLPGLYNTVFTGLMLVSSPDGLVGTGDDNLVASSFSPGTGALNLTFGANTGGNYYLSVVGMTNGQQGGIYNGAISVTAVPEPETYAMFLAGLGALGFLARRRKNA